MRIPSHWTYASWFTVLRIYTGLFWFSHGISKFMNGDAYMPPSGFMPQLVKGAVSAQTGFYHDFLLNVVTPNMSLFADLVRLGEVLVGVSLVLGALTRLGGFVGCFLALNYLAAQGEFSKWTAVGSTDTIAFVLSFLMLVVPAGRVAGIDALLFRPAVRKDVVVPELVPEPASAPAPESSS